MRGSFPAIASTYFATVLADSGAWMGNAMKFRTNSDKLKGLGDYDLARFLRELACPPDAKSCEADSCADCWKKWFESPADMEFWQNFEEEKRNED